MWINFTKTNGLRNGFFVNSIGLSNGGLQVELNDAQWSYNPHEGFAIDSPTLVDDGYYECIATSPKNRNQTVLFVFDVKRKFAAQKRLLKTTQSDA